MTEKAMTDKKAKPVHPVLNHFREDSPGTPHLWCPGCGVGQVWHYTTKAIEELASTRTGCSGWAAAGAREECALTGTRTFFTPSMEGRSPSPPA